MPAFATRGGDQRLAELAARGDERAFEAIYDRHHAAQFAQQALLAKGEEALLKLDFK